MLPTRRVLAAACAALILAPAAASADPPAALPTYEVGVGHASIAVNADGSFGGGKVYLGGFGVGSDNTVIGQGIQDRHATGNLGAGPSIRAFVVSDGRNVFAIADAELQGWFAASKDGPVGIMDVRRRVAAATNGAIPADHVVVQSDHTHGGPDLLGVWGGAPMSYRQYVTDQAVKAIVDAWKSRQAGSLWYGTANGRDLLNNQFDYDESNKLMDSDVRVLQARDQRGKPFATMLNFSAHATVLGSGNTKATGDWVQAANPLLEDAFGGDAMTVVGTVGRTQPARTGCSDQRYTHLGNELCSIYTYSKRVVDRAQEAMDHAQPLTGKAEVVARSYLITDPSSNAVLLGMLYGGAPLGMPVNRSMTPPYLTGDVLGTISASARIGDVLLSSGPGEMYPQIPLELPRRARDRDVKIRGYMTAGLANDQLGYIIAPYRAYPEPIKTSFFDESFANGDVIGRCSAGPDPTCAGDPTPSPIANDNYFFNASHTLGERLTCSLLRGAGEVFGVGTVLRDDRDECAPFANDAALPAGSDVSAATATKDVPALPAVPPGR
jgi:hypothetical protein